MGERRIGGTSRRLLKGRRRAFHRRVRSDELSVTYAEVLALACRMCGARPLKDCVPYGAADRDHNYRAGQPHNLRIGDAREIRYGRRW